MNALFYVNGVAEGLFSLRCWTNPQSIYPKEKIARPGQIYARLYGSLMFGFSLASIYMAKQPSSDAKNIFSLAFLHYHFCAAANVAKGIINGQTKDTPSKVICIFHTAMTIAFVKYLKDNGFSINLLLFKN